MRGHINSVQALLRKEVLRVCTQHRDNHGLNLVLIDATKHIEEVEVFSHIPQ